MKYLSVVLCIALLFASVPLVKAQEQPATEPPVIPPDIAESLSSTGMAPLISLVFDLFFVFVNGFVAFVLDVSFTLVDLIFDLVDTIAALCLDVCFALWYEGSLVSLVLAWCNVCCGCFPILTYLGGCTSAILCCMRYIPCCAYIPNCWNACKVTCQICGFSGFL